MERKLRPLIGLSLFAASIAAHPCAIVTDGSDVHMANENVVIVWDAAKKVQHFIRETMFKTDVTDFGFIVPTPSVPDLGVASAAVFPKLQREAAKREVELRRLRGEMSAGGAGGMQSSVSILKSERVGDYQATVIRATDSAALQRWMTDNGYNMRPAFAEWLDFYVKKGWILTALKLVDSRTGPHTTQAIRISFRTDEIVYPYRMPVDTKFEHNRRRMNVFVLANGPAIGHVLPDDRRWSAAQVVVPQITPALRAEIANNLGLPLAQIDPNAMLTRLGYQSVEKSWKKDLVIHIEASPRKLNQMATGTVAGLVLMGAVIGWRTRRRRP